MNTSRFGHWVVARKAYTNKLQAVTKAVPNGWWPHFYFREDEFSAHDWTAEPSASLESLYFARARQLRENYDHITIEYSGGVDSWYILYSFVAQGLHVDVVNHRFIEAAATGDESDTSAKNIAAEGKYTAYPEFKKFQDLVPTMQWNSYNATDLIVDGWANHKLDPFKYNSLFAAMISRVPTLANDPIYKTPNASKIAVIYGVDKPNLFFEDGKFFLYFPDHALTGSALHEREAINFPWEDVLFYYDPECCDLLIKQAHIIMNWFKQNPQFLPLISNRHYRNNEVYHKLLNKLVYPKYGNKWQAKKQKGRNFTDAESWFYDNYENTNAVKNWRESQQQYSDIVVNTLSNTDFECFMKQDPVSKEKLFDLTSSWSKLYYIGTLH